MTLAILRESKGNGRDNCFAPSTRVIGCLKEAEEEGEKEAAGANLL
jgi:hypothetical protein